jgi:cytoskeletal protein RodZ
MVTRKKEDSAEEVISEAKVCAKKKCCGMSSKFWWLVAIIILVVAGYYAWTVYKPQPSQAEAQKMAEQQVMALVAKVRRHMVLPEKEVPQVAEIKDAALAAKEQPFLAGSQNGDVLLVYTSISKAIVYSPARDVIVNVGPVQMNNTDTYAQTGATTSSDNSDTVVPKKK